MQSDIQLFNNLVNIFLETEKEEPVTPAVSTDALQDEFDLELRNSPMLDEEFAQTLKKLVLATPKTASKMFFNQLFGGRQSKSVLGDLLAVILNNSMYTYKVAGPQVGVEKAVIDKLNEIVGFGENASGTIAPGGSMSNLMGMIMARDKADPDARDEGVSKTMVVYTSNESHYSIVKNASFIGIGRHQVRKIPADFEGRMNVDLLKQAIESDIMDGKTPIMVNATAGTTVLGAFDPINEIADLCKKYSIWLHVDGAYCGGVVLSDKHKHLISGVERADSFSLNAHKIFMTPLTCSLFLTPHKDQLYTSFSSDADYLYQTDEDEYNLGKTSLQCGRRNDALKFWTLWKSVGTQGLQNIVENQFALADYGREYVRNNPDYVDFSIDESMSICFTYKGYPSDEICTLLYEQAELMVGFGFFKDQDFIRLVTINANNSVDDIDSFFEKLEEVCEKHSEELSRKSELLRVK